jgi:hypothetical protein
MNYVTDGVKDFAKKYFREKKSLRLHDVLVCHE